MTTIYELEKQATPGPFETRKGKAAHVCLYVAGTAYNVAVGMKEKDAKIFTHCRNHFMEALGLITELMLEIERDKGYTSDWAEEMLKKLETVE